jgi:tRNA-2-methylthio-N6-dimethylallyladenosine synthase
MTTTTTPELLPWSPEGAAPSRAGRRVFLETFGCQMNVLDSELVSDQLKTLGYSFVKAPEQADVVLYNTCSVRELSEHKVLSRLGVMKQRKQAGEDFIVGVLGCMAERAGKELADRLPHVDLMCGPSELDRLPVLLENLRVQRSEGKGAQLALSGHNARRSRTQAAAEDRLEALDQGRLVDPDVEGRQAYVRITRGCNKFCSFCIVPFTRGPEVHRPADAIVEEVRGLARSGAREVTLLGQTINHYSAGDTTFAALLRRVHDEVPELKRLRFLTSYPRDFTDEALDVMAGSERICPYLHIPAQSGSDRVLKAMNRGYTRELYLNLIRRAKERMPDISIVGDMIVGFPGETEEDFQLSMSLLEEVRYKGVFVFKYSTRPGTVASKKLQDNLPDEAKKDRNHRMLELQQRISKEHHEAMVGREVEVLVEGSAKYDPASRGPRDEEGQPLLTLGKAKLTRSDESTRLTSRTRGDHIVAFDGPESLVGELARVRVTHATGLSLSGELV